MEAEFDKNWNGTFEWEKVFTVDQACLISADTDFSLDQSDLKTPTCLGCPCKLGIVIVNLWRQIHLLVDKMWEFCWRGHNWISSNWPRPTVFRDVGTRCQRILARWVAVRTKSLICFLLCLSRGYTSLHPMHSKTSKATLTEAILIISAGSRDNSL